MIAISMIDTNMIGITLTDIGCILYLSRHKALCNIVKE